MHPASDGLEVVDGEGIGKVIPVPPHDIKRMSTVGDGMDHALLADVDGKSPGLVNRSGQFWCTEIPFAEWTVLQQLTKVVAVALWGHDGMGAFYNQPALL